MIGSKAERANTSNCIQVSNLNYNANEVDLQDFLKQKGFDAIRVRLFFDDQGDSKGSGFVELQSEDEVQRAVKSLDQTLFMKRPINVYMSKPRN